jgi:hypothetical protein
VDGPGFVDAAWRATWLKYVSSSPVLVHINALTITTCESPTAEWDAGGGGEAGLGDLNVTDSVAELVIPDRQNRRPGGERVQRPVHRLLSCRCPGRIVPPGLVCTAIHFSACFHVQALHGLAGDLRD